MPWLIERRYQMPKSLKKTIIYSNEETKDIIEKTMEELNEQYGVKMSKIIESMILCNIAPEHPKTSIWKAIKSNLEKNRT